MASSPSSSLKLQPSSSARWLKCKASPGFIVRNTVDLGGLPESSVYADEGQEAHAYAAAMLEGKEVQIPDGEMAAYVCDYVRYVLETQRALGGELIVEAKVPLFYYAGETGTTDAGLNAGHRGLHIFDLKYGAGISVEAEDNTQLLIYLRGLADRCGLTETADDALPVSMTIFQPRARDGRVVRRWATTFGEVRRRWREIEATAMDIQLEPDDQPFAPEPDGICRFCVAKAICKAYAGHLLGEVPDEAKTEMPSFPHPDTLALEQLSAIVRIKRDFISWLETVEDHVIARMSNGEAIPGVKLVEGKSFRQWVDEEEAYEVLKRFVDREKLHTTPEFLSVSKVEELLKHPRKPLTARFKNRFEKLFVKPQGKPTLVNESDPRPAINVSPTADLEDISLL